MIDAVLGWFGLKRQREHTAECQARTIAILENDLKHLHQRIVDLECSERYWKARAELFIDRGLAKVGLVHEPVMTGRPEIPSDPYALNPLAGASIMEFDSTKKD